MSIQNISHWELISFLIKQCNGCIRWREMILGELNRNNLHTNYHRNIMPTITLILQTSSITHYLKLWAPNTHPQMSQNHSNTINRTKKHYTYNHIDLSNKFDSTKHYQKSWTTFQNEIVTSWDPTLTLAATIDFTKLGYSESKLSCNFLALSITRSSLGVWIPSYKSHNLKNPKHYVTITLKSCNWNPN